ncbi:P-loop containing nucleoside triphosphate hydrolase protein [Auriscalpium vulgare]|uniref:P-loop containing nucleoside triphosphate hydrolase protein n=1 Tax=Auriscalpium vulgare TaxID=40419 RepID=A0ACB8RRI3_9AGAM|nr:P-loop containing nucleoside triphosphate hydrolase protein [Auriscalpium vulgare]
MDAIAAQLAQVLSDRLLHTPPDARLLVGISGIPASGKSTLAALIVAALDAAAPGRAVLVGLDGWHLTRAQLDALPDPQLAHDRRGIHWTFDAPAYVSFVRALRQPVAADADAEPITAPSFDHAVKDPTPHAVSVLPAHRIVVIEGLYTFLSIQPWAEAGLLLDERWWVELEEQEATRRLVKRHVVSGVAKDLDEAHWRADENDMPNGRFMIANLLEPTRVIDSVEDPVFAVAEHA